MIFVFLSVLALCIFMHKGFTININIQHSLNEQPVELPTDAPTDDVPTAITNMDSVITNINELMGVDNDADE